MAGATRVLSLLKEDILNPRAITVAIEQAVPLYTAQPDTAEQRAALAGDLTRLDTEIRTLTDHLAGGEPPGVSARPPWSGSTGATPFAPS